MEKVFGVEQREDLEVFEDDLLAGRARGVDAIQMALDVLVIGYQIGVGQRAASARHQMQDEERPAFGRVAFAQIAELLGLFGEVAHAEARMQIPVEENQALFQPGLGFRHRSLPDCLNLTVADLAVAADQRNAQAQRGGCDDAIGHVGHGLACDVQ